MSTYTHLLALDAVRMVLLFCLLPPATAMRAMFDPPPPLEFKKPVSKRTQPEVTGLAAMLKAKKDLFESGPPPPKEKFETPRQRHARIAESKKKVKLVFGIRQIDDEVE